MDEELLLTIGEVAAMSGVAADTVRAWERRHAAVSPERTPAGHRRYRIHDVETLRRVRHNLVARRLSLKLAVAEARGLPVEDLTGAAEPGVRAAAEPAGGAGAAAVEPGVAGAPWRAVADLLPEAVCIVDERGEVVDGNIAFARTAGALRMRLPGTRFLGLVDPGDRAKAARLYRPRPQPRRGWELNLRTPAGCGLYSFESHPVQTATGTLIVLVGREVISP